MYIHRRLGHKVNTNTHPHLPGQAVGGQEVKRKPQVYGTNNLPHVALN